MWHYLAKTTLDCDIVNMWRLFYFHRLLLVKQQHKKHKVAEKDFIYTSYIINSLTYLNCNNWYILYKIII